MNLNHIVDLSEFPITELNKIIDLGYKIKKDYNFYYKSMENNILATLFFEPSTRTMFSFETAMIRLGGNNIGFDNPSKTSISKGESFTDTIKTISAYSDLMVIRHSIEGAAKLASYFSDIPVINAGDGGHLHPTQTLTDLLTIYIETKSLNNLVIGFCGDLKNGRTVHSLIKSLSLYKNNKFIFISTDTLKIPKYIRRFLDQNKCSYIETLSIDEYMAELDILYMTRIQKERFESEVMYIQEKDKYILTTEKISNSKKSLKILHPLPRTNEIDIDVDFDEKAIYFKQLKYGVYARMALIVLLMHDNITIPISKAFELENKTCTNPKCISQVEKSAKKLFKKDKFDKNILNCDYCDYLIY